MIVDTLLITLNIYQPFYYSFVCAFPFPFFALSLFHLHKSKVILVVSNDAELAYEYYGGGGIFRRWRLLNESAPLIGESDKEDGLQVLKLGTAVDGQVDKEGREREWRQK